MASVIRYPVQNDIQYLASGRILYLVQPTTNCRQTRAATEFYGIQVECTINDIKLTWQTVPSIIQHYPESGRICYSVLSRI